MFNEYMTNFCSMSEGGWLICTCVSQGHVWPQQQQQKGSPVLPLSFSSCLCTSTSVTPPMLPFHYTLTNTHLPPATGFCPPLHTGQLMAIGACAFGEATELQTYIIRHVRSTCVCTLSPALVQYLPIYLLLPQPNYTSHTNWEFENR